MLVEAGAGAMLPTPPAPRGGAREPRPAVVGGGGTNDFMISQPNIVTAQGSFPAIADVTSEVNVGNDGTFSLQINSNLFPDPNCGGQGVPGTGSVNHGACAWEQFVYVQSTIMMQYWLVNVDSLCPATWTADGKGNCYYTSAAGDVPTQPIGNLPNMVLLGETSSLTDFVQLFTGTGVYRVIATPALDLSQGGNWNEAEFNVFGDANYSTSVFNSGATLVGQLTTTSNPAPTAPPTCFLGSTTGETSNLSLVPGSCDPFTTPTPGIVFMESNGTPLLTPSKLALTLTQGDPNGADIGFAPSTAWDWVDVSLAGLPSAIDAVPLNPYGFSYNLSAGKTTPLGATIATVTATGADLLGHPQTQSWPIRITVVAPPPCVPATCATLGAGCGDPPDGCGGTLVCGGCADGETCGDFSCQPPPPPYCNPADCVCAPGYSGGGCATSGPIGCAPCTPVVGGGGKNHCLGTCF